MAGFRARRATGYLRANLRATDAPLKKKAISYSQDVEVSEVRRFRETPSAAVKAALLASEYLQTSGVSDAYVPGPTPATIAHAFDVDAIGSVDKKWASLLSRYCAVLVMNSRTISRMNSKQQQADGIC